MMTVLKKSECKFCHPAIYTGWDRFLDSSFMMQYLWAKPWGAWYIKLAKSGSRLSKRYHQRFHG